MCCCYCCFIVSVSRSAILCVRVVGFFFFCCESHFSIFAMQKYALIVCVLGARARIISPTGNFICSSCKCQACAICATTGGSRVREWERKSAKAEIAWLRISEKRNNWSASVRQRCPGVRDTDSFRNAARSETVHRLHLFFYIFA